MYLCHGWELDDGLHELLVTVINWGAPFWLDWLVFFPSPETKYEGDVIFQIESNNHNISYIGQWNDWNGAAQISNFATSQAKFDFFGNGVTLVADIPADMNYNPSLVSISIDNGTEEKLLIKAAPRGVENRTTLYHVPFYMSPPLDNGAHSLLLTYEGNSDASGIPLILDYTFVTSKSPSASWSMSPTGVPTTISPSITSSPSHSSRAIGGIVGGIIGGLAIVSLMIVFWWYRRRTTQAKLIRQLPSPSAQSRPYDTVPEPFIAMHRFSVNGVSGSSPLSNHQALGIHQSIPGVNIAAQRKNRQHAEVSTSGANEELPPMYSVG
ncbi:hypothetical protein H0H87_009600 [Tephrocybe sp. NHM501043]|nr:hypothetical protein H0H87_009600 [Tephrocybe sp. NHM501043]